MSGIVLRVADTIIDYRYFHTEFFENRLSAYAAKDVSPDTTINYTLAESIALPPHTVEGRAHDATYGRCENGDIIMYISDKSGCVLMLMRHSDDYSVNTAASVPLYGKYGETLTDAEREYLAVGSAFQNRLLYNGGLVMHGSCISYRGDGIVFSAPCGTGKSTHTALWKKLFGDDVFYINDDKPAILPVGDGFFVHGTPFSGKTTLNSNIKAPLKAIVFIVRGDKNVIKPLDTVQAFCWLNDQSFAPFYDKRLCVKKTEIIEKIIKTVPILRLECNMDDNAAIVAHDGIYK